MPVYKIATKENLTPFDMHEEFLISPHAILEIETAPRNYIFDDAQSAAELMGHLQAVDEILDDPNTQTELNDREASLMISSMESSMRLFCDDLKVLNYTKKQVMESLLKGSNKHRVKAFCESMIGDLLTGIMNFLKKVLSWFMNLFGISSGSAETASQTSVKQKETAKKIEASTQKTTQGLSKPSPSGRSISHAVHVIGSQRFKSALESKLGIPLVSHSDGKFEWTMSEHLSQAVFIDIEKPKAIDYERTLKRDALQMLQRVKDYIHTELPRIADLFPKDPNAIASTTLKLINEKLSWETNEPGYNHDVNTNIVYLMGDECGIIKMDKPYRPINVVGYKPYAMNTRPLKIGTFTIDECIKLSDATLEVYTRFLHEDFTSARNSIKHITSVVQASIEKHIEQEKQGTINADDRQKLHGACQSAIAYMRNIYMYIDYTSRAAIRGCRGLQVMLDTSLRIHDLGQKQLQKIEQRWAELCARERELISQIDTTDPQTSQAQEANHQLAKTQTEISELASTVEKVMKDIDDPNTPMVII